MQVGFRFSTQQAGLSCRAKRDIFKAEKKDSSLSEQVMAIALRNTLPEFLADDENAPALTKTMFFPR